MANSGKQFETEIAPETPGVEAPKTSRVEVSETPGVETESGLESESSLGQFESSGEGEGGVKTNAPVSSGGVGAPGIDTSKSILHQEIENVLEEDLEDIYFSLDPATQEKFKQEGERVTKEISTLLTETKATFNKVFRLIFGWLKIIPGVNKFFLQQEAKIKADKILVFDKNYTQDKLS